MTTENTQVATVAEAITRLRMALARDLTPGGIFALTRLQMSPYRVTYRGQPLGEVLYFSDPKGRWA